MIGHDPAKAFLLSVREARLETARLREKLAKLEAQTTSITASLSGMPHSGDADAERQWAALCDLRSLYAEKLLAAEQQELEVSDFIDSIPNDIHRVVLRYRYLGMNSWEKVQRKLAASNVCYELRQIYRIHGMALNEARALWADTHTEQLEEMHNEQT